MEQLIESDHDKKCVTFLISPEIAVDAASHSVNEKMERSVNSGER